MPQHLLYFRQLCPTLQHSPGQTMPQHVGCDTFQPPGQVLQRLASCDVPLQLCLGTQLLRCTQTKLLHGSLRDPLGDSYLRGLSFRRHSDSDQKSFSLLVTADGGQSRWATHALKIAVEKTLGIWMQRQTTRFSCLATADRNSATSQIKIAQLQIACLLHTEPYINEQRQ